MDWVTLLETIDRLMWEKFLIFLLLFVGFILTVRLKGMQFRYLPYALKLAFSRHDDNAEGDISQFQSLMTALAATIGIGSIAGMATAVMAGGYGAIFWMWVMATIGMVTKYAEAILAVKYREVDHRGEMCGGPMYYIEKGLGWKWLGVLFAIFGSLSAFAGGNLTQSHSIADSMYTLIGVPHYVSGLIFAILTGFVILGGIKSLGKVNAILVPLMALFYMIGGLIVITANYEMIPDSFRLIFKNAFTGQAAIGGFAGAGVMAAIQMGIVRGISSNEAGLGSAPIAAAAAKTDVPGRQALISMTGVFLASFIVCTITVLVISLTGVLGSVDDNGNVLNGAPLVMAAFNTVIPHGQWIVAIGLICFGFSTILGWSYYGEKCIEYLFGEKALLFYRFIFIGVVFVGSMLTLDVVWYLVDIMNGLMAFPNLIGLIFLTPVIALESKGFFALLKKEKEKS
ncbi:MAG: sodium:alanine symporter family protein [Chlamydiae bacterium CG10_big_fil_rev_8_21_14_0_10_35_9]|nr:MAG: sodium:alanine symporter family protein [Chlamydiae bacterium CG10_big_fil_rev_8_21_14_0_10_35_9]